MRVTIVNYGGAQPEVRDVDLGEYGHLRIATDDGASYDVDDGEGGSLELREREGKRIAIFPNVSNSIEVGVRA